MALAERELNKHVGVTLEQWMIDNEGLIKSIAGKYYWAFRKAIAPFDFDDLYQIAAMEVIVSYDRFVKMNDNVDFKKYVVHWMHFRVKRWIDFKARSIHIPLLQRKRDHTDRVLSLNHKLTDEEDELSDFVLVFEEGDYVDIDVHVFIKSLDERKRKVLSMRMEGYHYGEIGEAIGGYTGETARNVLKAIRKDWEKWSGPVVGNKPERIGPAKVEGFKTWAIVAAQRGIKSNTYYKRILKGMTPEEAATVEVAKTGPIKTG